MVCAAGPCVVPRDEKWMLEGMLSSLLHTAIVHTFFSLLRTFRFQSHLDVASSWAKLCRWLESGDVVGCSVPEEQTMAGFF